MSYVFGVDGELVDFRHGDLSIWIQVEHPGDHGSYAGSGAAGWGAAGSYVPAAGSGG